MTRHSPLRPASRNREIRVILKKRISFKVAGFIGLGLQQPMLKLWTTMETQTAAVSKQMSCCGNASKNTFTFVQFKNPEPEIHALSQMGLLQGLWPKGATGKQGLNCG